VPCEEFVVVGLHFEPLIGAEIDKSCWNRAKNTYANSFIESFNAFAADYLFELGQDCAPLRKTFVCLDLDLCLYSVDWVADNLASDSTKYASSGSRRPIIQVFLTHLINLQDFF